MTILMLKNQTPVVIAEFKAELLGADWKSHGVILKNLTQPDFQAYWDAAFEVLGHWLWTNAWIRQAEPTRFFIDWVDQLAGNGEAIEKLMMDKLGLPHTLEEHDETNHSRIVSTVLQWYPNERAYFAAISAKDFTGAKAMLQAIAYHRRADDDRGLAELAGWEMGYGALAGDPDYFFAGVQRLHNGLSQPNEAMVVTDQATDMLYTLISMAKLFGKGFITAATKLGHSLGEQKLQGYIEQFSRILAESAVQAIFVHKKFETAEGFKRWIQREAYWRKKTFLETCNIFIVDFAWEGIPKDDVEAIQKYGAYVYQ